MAERMRPGPKKGYKQSPEHIHKRIKRGADHPNWKGDDATRRAGRTRALRMYADQPCTECGATPAERHHVNGVTTDNSAENIQFLCRDHHMAEHKRLGTFKTIVRARDEKGRYVRVP